MTTERQRQRVARFEMQRERYLAQRQRAVATTLADDRHLLATRFRFLPLLLVTPFALLTVAGAMDLFFLVTGNSLWTTLSFAMVPIGVAGSSVTLVVGLHDWFAAPAGSRVRSVGVWFAIGTILVLAIFVQSWVARVGISGDNGGLSVILGYMGSAVALLTGWLLGEYLERLTTLVPAIRANRILLDQSVAPQRIDTIVDQPRVAHA